MEITDPPRRFKVTIEYDGTDFHGWQRQPNVRTVQEEIEKALARILCTPTTCVGAGRTDAGVHATGQVAHFITGNPRLASNQLLMGVNSLLPHDVKLTSVEEVGNSFHARFSAISRRYCYRIVRRYRPLTRRYTWSPNYRWDDAIIHRTVELLMGEHSFRSFCRARPGEKDYICQIIEARWETTDDPVQNDSGAIFHICADRFFHRMVRGLVHTLIDVGRGYLSPDDFRNLLEHPKRNGDVRMAPPQGLTLTEVKY